ncbi:MAG: porin [Ferruginibacter sp.]|nr:porin [Ferruginibacter sp.]
MKKFFLATTVIIATLITNCVVAQDSTKSLTISGSVDAYYRYNFADNVDYINNFTSFTNSQNSFELGMASVRADASAMSGKVTATVDLGFGRRAEEFSYNDGVSDQGENGFFTLANIKQLYITYAPSTKVKFTMGKFGTHVGYELLDAPLNRNYSMAYMFTNGPFFHTGLKMDITAGPVGFMLGIANYTDQSTSTIPTKSLLGQISGASSNGKIKAFFNYVGSYGSKSLSIPGGLKSLSQYDLVVTAVVTSKFNIGFNGTIQDRKTGITATSGSWKGAALYLNVDPSATVGLTLRSEYIGDKKMIYFNSFNPTGSMTVGTKSIFANTLSLNYKVGPFTLIPELRIESGQSAIYAKNNGTASKSTATALLAALYKF